MKYFILPLSIILLFSACSSKKYFEPEETEGTMNLKRESLPSTIRSMNKIGATLKNNQIITRQGVSKFKLPDGFDFINVSADGRILATNYKDKLLIGNEQIDVKNVVIAASLKNDKLAIVYSNNTLELIDLQTKQTLFKDYQPISLANDTRVTNPHFMGNLILFPTLNGKVIIVSSKTNKSVKNITVDPNGEFNNIIFLHVLKDLQTLIVASPNKIVSISPKEILAKDYELRDILVNDKDIYIALIDGSILKLSANLEVVSKTKFKYAKIHSLAYTDTLYAIESQGYLLKVDNDFGVNRIYDFNFDNEERIFVSGNKVYNEDIITLP